MGHTGKLLCLGATIAGICLSASDARAVVVSGTAPTGYSNYNTSATAAFPAFSNVGTVNGSSGVYLGNGYAITASHVGAGSLILTNSDGSTTTYTRDTTVAVTRLQYDSTTGTDLFVFKLNGPFSSLANLDIASSPATLSSSYYLAGNGLDRDTAVAGGYTLAATQKLRFGTASVVGTSAFTTADSSGNVFGTQKGFQTLFTNADGSAQAVSHDSGGGVFSTALSGGNNTLQGLMLAMSTVASQPGNTAYYGDKTYVADLSYYRTQINTITGIPEPGTLGFLGLLGLLGFTGRRRSR